MRSLARGAFALVLAEGTPRRESEFPRSSFALLKEFAGCGKQAAQSLELNGNCRNMTASLRATFLLKEVLPWRPA
jgi:hypothetical protein